MLGLTATWLWYTRRALRRAHVRAIVSCLVYSAWRHQDQKVAGTLKQSTEITRPQARTDAWSRATRQGTSTQARTGDASRLRVIPGLRCPRDLLVGRSHACCG